MLWRLSNDSLLGMTTLRLLAVAACAAVLSSCSSGVDMPKGNSKGYTSARLVKLSKDSEPITAAREKKAHSLIQSAIKTQFTGKGLSYNQPNADLVVGYMVVYQDNSLTTSFDDYFGYGRDNDKILSKAHKKGVIDGNRPDYFERAGLVVDVIDAKTNKLVFRNVVKGDLVNGPSDVTRSSVVNRAVANALAPFFK